MKGVDRHTGRRRAAWLALALAFAAPALAQPDLDDPMRPPGPRTQEPTPSAGERIAGLNLTSTVVAPNRRIAVIDGRRLRIGDAVAGARIVAIEPAAVRLRAEGRSYTLRLLPQTIKRPAQGADGRETHAR